MKLTLCDTVGFGDQVNKEDSFGPVVDYVDSQFEAYLQGKWSYVKIRKYAVIKLFLILPINLYIVFTLHFQRNWRSNVIFPISMIHEYMHVFISSRQMAMDLNLSI